MLHVSCYWDMSTGARLRSAADCALWRPPNHSEVSACTSHSRRQRPLMMGRRAVTDLGSVQGDEQPCEAALHEVEAPRQCCPQGAAAHVLCHNCRWPHLHTQSVLAGNSGRVWTCSCSCWHKAWTECLNDNFKAHAVAGECAPGQAQADWERDLMCLLHRCRHCLRSPCALAAPCHIPDMKASKRFVASPTIRFTQ